jgi:7-cyano-7-deazaguanine reductase
MPDPASSSSFGPLGQPTAYPTRYDPALLFRVPRAPQRALLGAEPWPLTGDDEWVAWEASWLHADGRPGIAALRFRVPSTSPAIVESKSVKLYLTALNDTMFASPGDYAATVQRDLSATTGANVDVELLTPAHYAQLARVPLAGQSIDDAPFTHDAGAQPDPAWLATSDYAVDEALYTELFRSVCPVTGQPDYASIHVRYRGPRIDRGALLRYLVAFRHHPGFHEHCVEKIAIDLWQRCRPQAMTVAARFTRRGGIDINPWRHAGAPLPPPSLAPTPTQ